METLQAENGPEFVLIYVICVIVLGCFAALAELLSRYNYTITLFKYKETYVYLLINGLAALVAYFIIMYYDVSLGPFTDQEVGRILTAGLSSMVILRSSFASIKIGDKKVEVGMAAVLQVFLDSADRAFDQSRSKGDLEKIALLMKDIDADKAKKELHPLCANLMQNVSQDELQQSIQDINKLFETELTSNFTKALNLGVILNRLTGYALLEAAVASIKSEISLIGGDDDTPKATVEKQKDELEKLIVKFQNSH